ncbi:nicotinamide-nucleotide amidase [Aquisalimonas sp.]|uniref:nicotinamide-nucleotide amidase n=1 Tax=unclassified Aquisalimonas TaxID=2644645 RepID=UPI0025BD379C|nr:nicotinamide-nucleotide amidase [Aquisalimonas sp.]
MDYTVSANAPAESRLAVLAEAVGAALADKRQVLTTAESCTGGWIAKTVTDVAGSSGWFHRGVVTYSNDAKAELLGVSPEQLARFGAVSEEVVRAMAEGALARSGADVAVAVSGVAGPDGGSESKPVGLVWFGWALGSGFVISRPERFPGGRDDVRRASVAVALEGVLRQLRREIP